MASLIGWIVVGLVSVGTLVGVLGIAVTSVMLAVRKVGELRNGQHPAPVPTVQAEPAAQVAAERAPVHVA